MSHAISPDKIDENRLCWEIRKVSPGQSYATRKVMGGVLHGELWDMEVWNGLEGLEGFSICIQVLHKSCVPPSPDISKVLFTPRVGICGESQDEIIAASANIAHTSGSEYKQFKISKVEYLSLLLQRKLLYFFLEVTKSGDNKTEKPKTRKRKIEKDYKELFVSGKNSDVTIEVKSKKFKCHKLILEARSPVFSAMMDHDMKEKATGIVSIEDSEPTIFHEFLLYLYTGNEEHFDWKNVVQLYKLGDKYAVEDLKSVCVEHMRENISQGNLFQLFLLSQQHKESKLSEAAVEYFVKNAKIIVETGNWDMFLKNNINEANVLIKALARNK